MTPPCCWWLYETGLSLSAVCQILGYTEDSIWQLLRQSGVATQYPNTAS